MADFQKATIVDNGASKGGKIVPAEAQGTRAIFPECHTRAPGNFG